MSAAQLANAARGNRVLVRGASWCLVVRENPSAYERATLGTVCEAAAVHELLRDRILAETCEVMIVLAVDGRNRVIQMSEVARGGLHGCSVSARDILRPMVACGASAMVLVHNHPSGDPSPSAEDISMTRQVAQAADVVGVSLLDHVVIAAWEGKNAFRSMLDLGVGGLGR